MKIIVMGDVRKNVDYLISWDVEDTPRYDKNTSVLSLWWDLGSDAVENTYEFKHKEYALQMRDVLDEFMKSGEVWFDAEKIYSTLQNIDNRANQLNSNNKSA